MSTRFPRIAWLAVLATVTTLGTAGTLVGCTGSSTAPPSAPTVAQAQDLLDREARAVRAGSATDALTDIDNGAASTAFRASQAAAFANLDRLPLTSWSYHVDGPVRDGGILRQARRRYGTPVLILRVTLRYALRGVDPVPDHHDLWLTFVRRGGRTLLAGDSDLAGQDAPSWAGPWQFGPVAVARGRDSLVIGPRGQRARLAALATTVDAAVPAVTRVWGRDWTRQVAVIVPSSQQEFARLAGGAESLSDVSAAAVDTGIDPLSRRPIGQRLVLNPDGLQRLSAVGQQIVVRHEVAHLAAAADTADITPRWLVEGFAEYVANRGSGQSVPVAASELRRAVAAGSVPSRLPADSSFAGSGAALARAYEQAWLACRLIAAQVGQAGLVRLYRDIGSALEPARPALRHAFAAVLHETPARFTTRWRAYLRAQLS